MIGGGKGWTRKLLDNTVKQYDPDGKFVYQKEFLDKLEIINEFNRMHVFIYASTCENLPITLLEGMAAGFPIICSNYQPMTDVLGDAGIYFDPLNFPTLTDAIEEYSSDRALMLKMAGRARRRAQQFSWTKCANSTFDF